MSELTVEVINKIEEMIPPTILSIGENTYASKNIQQIPVPIASELEVFSLESVLDYVNLNPDKSNKFIINVSDYNEVMVLGSLNENKERSMYLHAKIKSSLKLNQYLMVEDFILMLLTCFMAEPQQGALLQIASNITDELIKTNKDDGITQSVTVKSGIARLSTESLPNPVKLVPYRTFPEITQPEGLFAFRAQKTNSGPMLGLFDVDQNNWKIVTIREIKVYLNEFIAKELKDNSKVIIL